METKYCQSCGMPLENETVLGTNRDGSKNPEYCSYCYENGAFKEDCTMEEMIDLCLELTVAANPTMDKAEAKEQMRQWYPTLARWRA